MSRIGKEPIPIPPKVEVQIDQVGVHITGPKGELTQSIRSCLLYTSPSPRDRTRSRMPSSA